MQLLFSIYIYGVQVKLRSNIPLFYQLCPCNYSFQYIYRVQVKFWSLYYVSPRHFLQVNPKVIIFPFSIIPICYCSRACNYSFLYIFMDYESNYGLYMYFHVISSKQIHESYWQTHKCIPNNLHQRDTDVNTRRSVPHLCV